MIIVVTGPPCGGKSTYVREQRKPDDLVIDLDVIAEALGYPGPQIEWGSRHPAVDAARRTRTQLVRAALSRQIRHDVWIVDAKPDGGMRAQYQRAGALLFTINPGIDECRRRAAGRPAGTLEGIAAWFAGGSQTSTALHVFGAGRKNPAK